MPTTNLNRGIHMTTTDRLAPLVAGLIVVALIVAGLLVAAHELSAALEGLAL